MGDWKVITPIGRTNYVLNPVALGVGNYAVFGAGVTLTTSTNYPYLGYKCWEMAVPDANTGMSLTLSALTNAIHYVTVRIHTASTNTHAPYTSLDAAAHTHLMTLLWQEGNFEVYGCQIPAVEANASTAVYIIPGEAVGYGIGHVQVEIGSDSTTPITGDIKGFMTNGYYWNGTPHAATSTRASMERSGGYIIDLSTSYNFVVQFGAGKGMPPITHHIQNMALLPGALYQGHKVEPRVLDLITTTVESTVPLIAHARKDFIEAVKIDKVVPEQPVVFRYTGANSNKPVEFYGYYDSGLESYESGGRGEQAVARFICYDPFAYEVGNESKVLSRNQDIANADYVVRCINGLWSNISTDFDGAVGAFTIGKDGCVYIGGNFDFASGSHITKWNPYTSALSTLTGGSGEGTSDQVKCLLTAPNGDIYLGGYFLLAGAIANTVYIAKWNGTEFVAMATGLNEKVACMALGIDGTLYIGGYFTNAGADANANYVCKWTGAAFDSIGEVAGADNNVFAMAIAPNGDLYITGAFANIGGIAAECIAKWNGTAWSALGSGLNDVGRSIAIDGAGNVYVGGAFTTADGVSCSHIAKWNGSTFEPLGTGLNGTVYTIDINDFGQLYAGGVFSIAGGLSLADRMATWNGASWAHLDIDLPGNPTVYSILLVSETTKLKNQDNGYENLYIGYDTAGTATASYTTDVVTSNSGSRYIYPVIKIYRADDGTSVDIQMIKNVTTGHKLMFDYSLQKGETLTIDLTPGNRSIKSDYYGDVWRAIIRGSDFASFGLLGGTNVISLYVKEVGSPTVVAWMEWKATHWAADTAAA